MFFIKQQVTPLFIQLCIYSGLHKNCRYNHNLSKLSAKSWTFKISNKYNYKKFHLSWNFPYKKINFEYLESFTTSRYIENLQQVKSPKLKSGLAQMKSPCESPTNQKTTQQLHQQHSSILFLILLLLLSLSLCKFQDSPRKWTTELEWENHRHRVFYPLDAHAVVAPKPYQNPSEFQQHPFNLISKFRSSLAFFQFKIVVYNPNPNGSYSSP